MRVHHPGVYYLTSVLTMAAFDSIAPMAVLVVRPWNWVFFGLLFGISVLLTLSSISHFLLRQTTFEPFETPTAFITDGPYRFSRNPMYLGGVIGLSGFALMFGSLTPWIMVMVYVWATTQNVIEAEEDILSSRFGEPYEHYKSTVRRWL